MKRAFPGHFRPTEQEFEQLWRECWFSVDTNVLLHVYRYSDKGQAKLIEILRKLSEADRLWIPHQVAFEYLSRRLGVISETLRLYRDRIDMLQSIKSTMETDLESGRPPFVGQDVRTGLMEAVEAMQADLQCKHESQKQLVREDQVLEQIADVFGGKVGAPYDDERCSQIREAGVERYTRGIPPGHADAKKRTRQRKPADATAETDGDEHAVDETAAGGGAVKMSGDPYGDLIMWHQLIDEAKRRGKPLIFVTDDRTKGDWFSVAEGLTIGPRPELIAEMLCEAKVQFHAYEVKRFMELAGDALEIDVQQAVSEVDGVRDVYRMIGNEDWNRRHLQKFFDARGDARRLTVRLEWSAESTLHIMPPQNIGGEVATIEQLEEVIRWVAEEWNSDVTCHAADFESSGEVYLNLAGGRGGTGELHWW